MIRINSLVRLDTTGLTDYETIQYPSCFHDGTSVIYLGEIPNMVGHGIFIAKNQHHIGYKVSLFEEVPVQDVLGIKVVS